MHGKIDGSDRRAVSARSWLVPLLVLTAACGSSAKGGGAGGGGGGGGVPSSVRIVASEGGQVQSEDGVFTLLIPPGALAEDTDLAIRQIPPAEWPAEVATSAPLAGVYDVSPEGLVFLTPAFGVHRWSSVPDALVEPEGYVMASHLTRSADGTIEPAAGTETVIEHDGGASVVATLEHLSWHYVVKDYRGQAGQRVFFSYEGDTTSSHFVGESWRGARFDFHSTMPLALVGVSASSAVGYSLIAYASPLEAPGWETRTSTYSFLDFWHHDPHERTATSPEPAEDALVQSYAADTAHAFSAPVPGFRCDDDGADTNLASVTGVLHPDGLTWFLGERATIELGPITCRPQQATGPKPGVGVVLGDFCDATRETSSIVCLTAPSGSLANAIIPTPAVEALLTPIGSTTAIFEGVSTWASVAGPPALDLATSTHSVTATHDGTAYAITGLTPGPVFTYPENLSVSGTPEGASSPVTVTVPAIDPNDAFLGGAVLGEVAGLATEMHGDDGAFDAMYVHATATGSSMAGEAGVMRIVPASAMSLDGANVRRAPLFDDATIAELASRGLTLDTILVGPVRFVTDDTLFPGTSIPVIAGRFLRVDAALLEPTPPEGECLPASADLTLATDMRVSLCYDGASMVCGMQHSESCGLSKRIGSFRDASGVFRFYADTDPYVPIVSASHGTINASPPISNYVTDLPLDTDITITIDPTALAIGTDYVRFGFRRTGDVVELLGFERIPPP